MDRNMRNQFAGVIFQLAMQNLQKMWHAEINLDSDDDEEENATMLQVFTSLKENVTRIDNYVENTVSNYSEQEFQSHFRLRYAAFESLENSLGPELTLNSHGQNIPVRKQLLTVLWLLATPDSFRSVGERFNLSKGSVYNSFVRVVKALNQIADGIIRWPSVTFKNQIKEQFKSFGGLEGVIGAIDGTFIEIKAPKEHAHVNTSRKCFYTMQLQAIAIPDLKFVDIITGYPGSVGDRRLRVFENSNIYRNIVSNKNQYFGPGEYILGDKAYPVLPWCIPPYIRQGELTQTQTNFNVKHAKTRQVIERAFALLYGRYRRLKYLDMNKTNLTPSTIMAICVLHNICLDHADLDFNQQAIAEGENYMASQQQQLLVCGGDPTAINVPASDAFSNNKEGLMFRNYLAHSLVP